MTKAELLGKWRIRKCMTLGDDGMIFVTKEELLNYMFSKPEKIG